MVKGRKKKDHVFTIDSEEEFRTEPSRFFQLNAADQKNIFKKFWKEGPYPCLSIGKVFFMLSMYKKFRIADSLIQLKKLMITTRSALFRCI